MNKAEILRNPESVSQAIEEWESEMGESFNDNFSHDNIKNSSWAFFLLGKGFQEHANNIITQILDGETCLDQEELYDIKKEVEGMGMTALEEVWKFNRGIMSEFLCATPHYFEKFKIFILKN